jgi:hypothetical protein
VVWVGRIRSYTKASAEQKMGRGCESPGRLAETRGFVWAMASRPSVAHAPVLSLPAAEVKGPPLAAQAERGAL